jgi:hypothetical protein
MGPGQETVAPRHPPATGPASGLQETGAEPAKRARQMRGWRWGEFVLDREAVTREDRAFEELPARSDPL